MLKKVVQFILFLGVGLGVMALVYRAQERAFQEQCRLDGIPDSDCRLLDKLWSDFSGVHLGWMGLVVLAFTVSNLLRAARWKQLLDPMGHNTRLSNGFLTILLGYFANLGFPRVGEIVRVGTLARYEGIPVEKVMGTLVVDRLADVACLVLVIGAAFLLEGQTLLNFIGAQPDKADGSFWGSPWLWMSALLGLASLGLAYRFRQRLSQLNIFRKLGGLLAGFGEGLRSVLRLKHPSLFALYSVGIWLMYYLQCYFNLLAFAPTAHLSGSAALMVFVFGTLGIVVPSPGGMGTFHLLAIAALSLYGIGGADAFSYANIAFFALTIFYNLTGGVLALILLPILNRKKA